MAPGDLSEADLPLWREVVASVLAAVDSGAPVAKMLPPIQTVNNGDPVVVAEGWSSARTPTPPSTD